MRETLLLAGRKAASAPSSACQHASLESSPRRLTAAAPAASDAPTCPSLFVFLPREPSAVGAKAHRHLSAAWPLSRQTRISKTLPRELRALGPPALWHTPALSPDFVEGRRTVRVIPTPGGPGGLRGNGMPGHKVPDSSGVGTLAARAHSATDCVCFLVGLMCFQEEALRLSLDLDEGNVYCRDSCSFGLFVLNLCPNVQHLRRINPHENTKLKYTRLY